MLLTGQLLGHGAMWSPQPASAQGQYNCQYADRWLSPMRTSRQTQACGDRTSGIFRTPQLHTSRTIPQLRSMPNLHINASTVTRQNTNTAESCSCTCPVTYQQPPQLQQRGEGDGKRLGFLLPRFTFFNSVSGPVLRRLPLACWFRAGRAASRWDWAHTVA